MIHFDKLLLNTGAETPYFQAHIPRDYIWQRTLIARRWFRNLPPQLRELADKSKRWASLAQGPMPPELTCFYDEEGYELDPNTGRRLTEAEILQAWEYTGIHGPPEPAADIPVPPGGFANPATWRPLPNEDADEEIIDRGLTLDQVLGDIASRGRERTADEYGLPDKLRRNAHTDREMAEAILSMEGKRWADVL